MGNEAQSGVWNDDVGAAWVRHADAYDATLEPFGRAVLDALAPQAGERVLDVGCGVGATTAELAARVAPGGEVVGVDISATMLAEAALRLPDLRFEAVDAQSDDLGEAAYDVAFSRFGVMFFEDPAAAFANLHRALRPGGRLGFVCFQPPPANPFILVPVAAAAAHLPVGPPPAPTEPGPFSLADPERVRSLLAGAGFAAVEVVAGPDQAVLHDAGDLAALAERLLEQNPVTGPPLAAADPELRATAIRAAADALAPHRDGDVVRLGAGTWVVTARA